MDPHEDCIGIQNDNLSIFLYALIKTKRRKDLTGVAEDLPSSEVAGTDTEQNG